MLLRNSQKKIVKRKKICLAASAGGHLSQLLLLEQLWESNEVVCVSTGMMVKEKLQEIGRTYIVGECNNQQPVRTFFVAFKCLFIVLKEKPDIIISTGAAVGFLICFWAKLFGAHVIWVDSIANTEDLSLSGRMIRRYANLILSQWPHVADRYPDVEYAGEII